MSFPSHDPLVDDAAVEDNAFIIFTTHHPDAMLPMGVTEAGTAQAGGDSTITFRSGASSVNDTYLGDLVRIVAGTGVGQSAFITGYVGATRVATISGTWATNPDSTSYYEVQGHSITEVTIPTAAQNATAVRDVALSGAAAGSLGRAISDIETDTDELQSQGVNVYSVRQVVIGSGDGSDENPWGP